VSVNDEFVNAVADEVIRRLNADAPDDVTIDLPGAVTRAAQKSQNRYQVRPADCARIAQALVRDPATITEIRHKCFPNLIGGWNG
jgi:hypothetical protein